MLTVLCDKLWNPWLLTGFLLVGLYCSLKSGFFQLFYLKLWLKHTVGSFIMPQNKDNSHQTVATALAATLGTGSIAGVATALFYGGPGAIFWMWCTGVLGLMIGCVEKILAVVYHKRDGKGGYMGGPMEYMEQGLGSRPLAVLFSICCLCASLGGGNLVQSNAIATGLNHAFGWSNLAVGGVTAGLVGLVILGGIGRIGGVCAKLVPAMAVLFLLGGGVALVIHRTAIPSAFLQIITEAFTPKATVGGGLGYGLATAMRYGVARGVFTSEAGVGSSAIAHGTSNVKDPAEEGLWGMLEVAVATLIVSTMTALVILTSGAYDPVVALEAQQSGNIPPHLLGAPLSATAFSATLGEWGNGFVALCLVLFAFSSLLGWSYYGQRCLGYLTGDDTWNGIYRLLFLVVVVIGSVADVSAVWQLADLFNGLMSIPNLIAIAILTPEAMAYLQKWTKKQGHLP